MGTQFIVPTLGTLLKTLRFVKSTVERGSASVTKKDCQARSRIYIIEEREARSGGVWIVLGMGE